MLLILKLCLVPSLVAAVTLATRRWGPRIGGWLTALPVIAGPTLCFYAIEQGNDFAGRAAQTTLIGLIAVVAHSVTYSHTCRRWAWLPCLLISWLAFLALTIVFYLEQPNLVLGLFLALLSFVIARRLLPSRGGSEGTSNHAARDLVLRMGASLGSVLVLTSLADRLGPSLSGFLTPFPVATAIIAAFTQIERGPDAVVSYFHGFVPALNSFALFCFVFAGSIGRFGLLRAVVFALLVQLTVQAVNLWRMMRMS